MQFVDDDASQITEQSRYFEASQDERRLQRLRRDQQDPARVPPCVRLDRGGDVAVPRMYREFDGLAQVIQPAELVIDQRPQRAHVEQVESASVVIRLDRARDQR